MIPQDKGIRYGIGMPLEEQFPQGWLRNFIELLTICDRYVCVKTSKSGFTSLVSPKNLAKRTRVAPGPAVR